MRLKIIGCKVLTREISYLAATSKNYIDMTWLKQGYHNEPAKLKEILQTTINDIEIGNDPCTCNQEAGDFDAILLCYGLCSNGVCGIKSTKYPIVIPRAHDCITLLLGDKKRYQNLFDEKSGGIYWYSIGWLENNLMPCKEREEHTLNLYAELYGEENAQYLLDMESGWLNEYKAAAFIEHDEIQSDVHKQKTKESAKYYGWDYYEYKGDLTLLRDLVEGNWDDERFLVVPPNKTIIQSFDDSIIKIDD